MGAKNKTKTKKNMILKMVWCDQARCERWEMEAAATNAGADQLEEQVIRVMMVLVIMIRVMMESFLNFQINYFILPGEKPPKENPSDRIGLRCLHWRSFYTGYSKSHQNTSREQSNCFNLARNHIISKTMASQFHIDLRSDDQAWRDGEEGKQCRVSGFLSLLARQGSAIVISTLYWATPPQLFQITTVLNNNIIVMLT